MDDTEFTYPAKLLDAIDEFALEVWIVGDIQIKFAGQTGQFFVLNWFGHLVVAHERSSGLKRLANQLIENQR